MSQAVSTEDELPFMSVAASVLFPGRINLYLHEVARALSITSRHVSDLIGEGKMGGIDISGGGKPKKVKPGLHCAAAIRHWRVPVSAFEKFIKDNRSDTITGL